MHTTMSATELNIKLVVMFYVLTFPNVQNRRDTPVEYTFRLQLVYLAHRIVMHILHIHVLKQTETPYRNTTYTATSFTQLVH